MSSSTQTHHLLWQKEGIAVDTVVQQFLAGDDVVNDRHLFVYDIEASKAHTAGLQRIGILSADEYAKIDAELQVLAEDFCTGIFVLDERFEDCHSAIEARLQERLGESGKRIHTGRSRNDQVLVAQRLYLRASLQKAAALCLDNAAALLRRAAQYQHAPMPGYTHLQRAVPSSVGLWLAGIAEGFIEDAALLVSTSSWLNRSPLGTAAGYGVNLPLDRTGVADALGFAGLQQNPVAAQNSRGKIELMALSALGGALLDVRRIAWDLSLFTTAEYGFVSLPTALTTGSSIMPNKRNPDAVELLRAAYGTVQGAMVEVSSVLSLPSGYQRDLQATKGPVLRAVEHAVRALVVLLRVIEGMRFDEEAMRRAISPDMYATDWAVELAASGMPFRDAYRHVADDLGALTARDPESSLQARVSFGACAQLGLDALQVRLDEIRQSLSAPL